MLRTVLVNGLIIKSYVAKSKLPRRKVRLNDVKRRHLGGGRINYGLPKPRYGRPAPVKRMPKLGDGL